jgi:hypothetical protein
MGKTANWADTDFFINTQQIGGIEAYSIDDGAGRGVRTLCVNTGGGLRYRVLLDRGLDLDQAFMNQYSLAFLSHGGVTRPSRALDRGIDWLKGFPGGLLTSCGPFNIGPPGTDSGEELGLHGTHSNTAAEIESIVQPNPRDGQPRMLIRGRLRYGKLFGPSLELRRTIISRLGENTIDIEDEFFNAANTPVPHAWLLHINFGYPLLEPGSEFCYDARIEPVDSPMSKKRFADGAAYRRVPRPSEQWSGTGEAVAYLFPRPHDRSGRATVGVVNRARSLGVAITYNTREFPRCGNWQHWGLHEFVGALEPMNGTVAGRWRDRERGLLDELAPGSRKTYRYQIAVLTKTAELDELLQLNETKPKRKK